MPRLFRPKMNYPALDQNTLATFLNKQGDQGSKQRFNLQEQDHALIISRCTADLIAKRDRLYQCHKNVLIGFLFTAVTMTFSFLLPFSGLLSTIGVAYLSTNIVLSRQAELEYRSALTSLGMCCEWALGTDTVPLLPNSASSAPNTAEIMAKPEIIRMMSALMPLLTERQLGEIIHTDINQLYIDQAQQMRTNGIVIEGQTLTGDNYNHHYKVYGHDQGSPLDMVKALVYLVKYGFSYLKNKWDSSEENTAAVATQDGAAAAM